MSLINIITTHQHANSMVHMSTTTRHTLEKAQVIQYPMYIIVISVVISGGASIAQVHLTFVVITVVIVMVRLLARRLLIKTAVLKYFILVQVQVLILSLYDLMIIADIQMTTF